MKRVLLAQLATLVALSQVAGSACLPTESLDLRQYPDAADTGPHPPDAQEPGRDAGPGADVEPTPPDGAVRIASLNTHLFFDTVCDSVACGGDHFEQVPSQEWFDWRANKLANGIRSIQPTVLLLQEVETQACLDALTQRLSDLFTVSILGEKPNDLPGSVDVAVLAKGELLEVRRHADLPLTRPDGTPTSFAREFLEVHLGINGERVIVFAAHFRSQNNDDPGRRLAEAQAAAQIVAATAAEFPQALVVMGGDLNDEPGSAPLLALTESGELFRVAEVLPPAEQITYLGFGGHVFDHLLLDTKARGSCLPGGVKVLCANGAAAGSDHCAIRADFGF